LLQLGNSSGNAPALPDAGALLAAEKNMVFLRALRVFVVNNFLRFFCGFI